MHVVALAAVGSGVFAGCLFNNTLYNAGGLYQEAENLRLADQDSASTDLYREVVAKATKEYEADEDSGWADDALLLIAKAQLRLGATSEATRAVERVLEISTSPPRESAGRPVPRCPCRGGWRDGPRACASRRRA